MDDIKPTNTVRIWNTISINSLEVRIPWGLCENNFYILCFSQPLQKTQNDVDCGQGITMNQMCNKIKHELYIRAINQKCKPNVLHKTASCLIKRQPENQTVSEFFTAKMRLLIAKVCKNKRRLTHVSTEFEQGQHVCKINWHSFSRGLSPQPGWIGTAWIPVCFHFLIWNESDSTHSSANKRNNNVFVFVV